VRSSVEILRDRAGVPHVYAETTSDVYFGLGFAMAEDRLWQMDRLRRRAHGRQAEILGPDYVGSDLLHRTVGITEIADAEVERTDGTTRQILESFVAGINRYIDECGASLPVEFGVLGYEPEPFTVRDSIAILRGEWWSLNGRLNTIAIGEAARLLPAHLQSAFLTPEADEFRILPPGSAYPDAARPELDLAHVGLLGTGDNSGSNNWAVAAKHTAAGHTILCSDPHQPFWVPSSWYEYAIHGPDDDAGGAGHPGVPGLWWGSNGTIAWGITNNAASARDLYREQVHPTDPNLYRDGDTWRRFNDHEVVIRVRGGAAVRHNQRATIRGPIVNHTLPKIDDADTAPLALRWVGQEHMDDVRAAIGVGRAHTWTEFRDALRDWGVAIFNFGYADASGRVGYQCAGRVPVRGRDARGYRDANSPQDVWQGYIPFDGLPSCVDPARGYVASANERVAPDDYPYALHGSWGTGYRAERIHQALEQNSTVDREFAVSLQNDVKSCRAERLCAPLVAHLTGSASADVARLREVLSSWDYRYTLESIAPTLFETFMELWQERVIRERFPAHLQSLLQNQTGVAASLLEHDDSEWFARGICDEAIDTAERTMQQVRARLGGDPTAWVWGAVHRAHWRHPLSSENHAEFDIGPQPVDGCTDTLRNTGVGQPGYSASSGTEYRLVVDFGEPDRFLAVQNIGNSGQPGSPHYADQFTDWLAGRYHVVSLCRADVERDLESSRKLERSTPSAGYADLGIRPVINASATLTRLGGSRMPPAVLDAMRSAAGSFVDILELQRRVGARIAEMTGNQACYVSSGAAAGMAISIAACLAGTDPEHIHRLPQVGDPQPEVVVFSAQRNGYDQAASQTGARLIEITSASIDDFERALSSRTACVLYFAGAHYASGAADLADVVRVAHAHEVPVLVDAAAQIPPISNLRHFTCELGADAAIFSGGKGLRGPQSSGLVLGRSALVEACIANGSPNHSLGRPMKVGKEELLGILAAVEWSLDQDEDAVLAGYEAMVQHWIAGLRGLSGVTAERGYPSEAGQPYGRAIVHLGAGSKLTRAQLVAALWEANPRIAVGQVQDDAIALNPQTLEPGEDEIVLRELCRLLDPTANP
jgi:uncharacterized pyridoxal phosphate-dependent enzyme